MMEDHFITNLELLEYLFQDLPGPISQTQLLET